MTMGQKLIITESEKNNILSLYEQSTTKPQMSFDSLIGKTFNLYQDESNSSLKEIKFENGIESNEPIIAYIGPTFEIQKPRYSDTISTIEIKPTNNYRHEQEFFKKYFKISMKLSCKYNPELIDTKTKITITLTPEGSARWRQKTGPSAGVDKGHWSIFNEVSSFTYEYSFDAYPSKELINLLNKNFNFCKKPKADFGSVQKPNKRPIA